MDFTPHPYIADRQSVHDAASLIANYGDAALDEAAARAHASRRIGNHVHYCRWRQIERLIGTMKAPSGLIH